MTTAITTAEHAPIHTGGFELPREKPLASGGDRCAKCGEQLAYLIEAKGATVACNACHHPAPPEHPLVVQLEQATAERAERNRAEQERLAKHYARAPQQRSPAEQQNPVDSLAVLVAALRREVQDVRKEAAEQRKEIAVLRGEIDQLKAAHDETRQPTKRR